jgi:hypothetical protein
MLPQSAETEQLYISSCSGPTSVSSRSGRPASRRSRRLLDGLDGKSRGGARCSGISAGSHLLRAERSDHVSPDHRGVPRGAGITKAVCRVHQLALHSARRRGAELPAIAHVLRRQRNRLQLGQRRGRSAAGAVGDGGRGDAVARAPMEAPARCTMLPMGKPDSGGRGRACTAKRDPSHGLATQDVHHRDHVAVLGGAVRRDHDADLRWRRARTGCSRRWAASRRSSPSHPAPALSMRGVKVLASATLEGRLDGAEAHARVGDD